MLLFYIYVIHLYFLSKDFLVVLSLFILHFISTFLESFQKFLLRSVVLVLYVETHESRRSQNCIDSVTVAFPCMF